MKTFIEVGSCDFNTLNYLSDYGWRGVIVEPIKKYLNNIEQKPNIHYLNYAVDKTSGVREMKVASDEQVERDRDYAGMSSFISENELLEDTKLVNTITFEKIFNLCDITQIDILKIDAEGYDLELIKAFPFHLIKPKYIRVEVEHIDILEMGGILSSHGYHCDYDTTDIFAILVNE